MRGQNDGNQSERKVTVRKRKKSRESKESEIPLEDWFPEIDCRSSPVNLTVYQLVYHHGGVFVDSPSLAYVNGKTKVIEWYDPEKLCVWTMLSIAASLGYDANSINHLRFCPIGVSLDEGLKLLFDDASVDLLCKHLEEEKLVNVYLELGESGITCDDVPLPTGYFEPVDEPVDLVVSSGDENHSFSDEEEARVLEQNEDEANDFVAVNVDYDSDGGGIGADPELVCSRNIVQKSLEAEERMRKMLEELEMEDFFEVVPMQQQRQKKKKKVTAGGPSGSENLGGLSGAENLGGPRVSDNVGGPRVAENVGGGASGGGNNAYGPNQNVEADKEGEESPYLPSDEPNNFIKTDSEDSEADDAQRCISSGLHFRPDGSIPEFFKDQIFTGPAQFKAALKEYSLGKKKAFYYKKNDKQRVRAHCSANGLTSKVVAQKFGEEISQMPYMRATQVRVMVKKTYDISIGFVESYLREHAICGKQKMCTTYLCKILEMEVLKQMDSDAHEHLVTNWDPRFRSLAYASDISKCDVIDNNMCECFNGVILEARHKPIISMLEDIRVYVMRRIVRNKKAGEKWKTNYGPRIIAKLEKIKTRAAKWEVEWNGDEEREDYEKLLTPVKGLKFWPEQDAEEVLPPSVPKKKGRRQTERRREELEGRKGYKKPRRKMTCGICRKPGHSRSKCPANHLNMGASSKPNPKQPSSSQPNSSTVQKKGKKAMQHGVQRHYTIINPGKETQVTIGIPVDGPPQNMTSVKELKAARRKSMHAREAATNEAPTQHSRETY
ncbi:Transposase, MuDR, plant [Corchorus olitorius]|uniref:Transposase, MuDR, plant n=1 Tax=Corchorus olitorius TaxID=93759 RepID=A0A1R3FU53_9ROSI|nr:Transposase, MuDR, plant [Corchorus olitorius]